MALARSVFAAEFVLAVEREALDEGVVSRFLPFSESSSRDSRRLTPSWPARAFQACLSACTW